MGATGMTMTLDGVTIEGVGMGVRMEKGTLDVKEGTTIDFEKNGIGVYMEKDVTRAELKGTVITGKESGYGIHAVGATGMTMTLDEVKISKVQTGVYAVNGTLEMEKGSVTEFTEYGVNVGVLVTRASLTGTVITGKGSGTGIHARGGTDMTMRLDNVTVSKVAIGVEMMAGMLTMTKGSIDFVGDYGVKLGSSVKSASLTGTTITGQDKGYGVYAVGAESLEMTLEKVEIKGVEMGVMMEKGGKSLTIRRNSTIEFKGDGVGVGVLGEVKSVNLTRTTITGQGGIGSMGVYAMGTGNGALTVALTDVKN
ncbi:right-handed parallel beta-helix repeat-containing protein [Bartonella schoenbuchensis]|uniref:Uncharacterized protein n=1 Tax=Bartonella schoenbuchensis m07a TaxID=1094496 RepID=N6VHE2_9HYPH|nr:right-handed parallel beta-helix repeat-containing protein [Bartonella schoenbuchensis]ENN92676.1 hypothetical protein m07a_01870 [Bartonella schoenbuchensis m07a]